MLWSAFVLGFFGGFHCLGMCGPISLALHGKEVNPVKVIGEKLLYNSGRVITYSLLGGIAGMLGQGVVWLTGYQFYFTILLGLLLVALGLLTVNPDKVLAKAPLLGSGFAWVRKKLGQLMRNAGWHTFLSIGFMNGFLPCGLVYVGLVGALATGSVLEGMGYMLMFGLGTFPMMLGIALAGQWVNIKWRNYVKKLYPVLFVVMGALLIFRATNIKLSTSNPHVKPTEIRCH